MQELILHFRSFSRLSHIASSVLNFVIFVSVLGVMNLAFLPDKLALLGMLRCKHVVVYHEPKLTKDIKKWKK